MNKYQKEHFADLRALLDCENEAREYDKKIEKRRMHGLVDVNRHAWDRGQRKVPKEYYREYRKAKRLFWISKVNFTCPVCKVFIGDDTKKWVVQEPISTLYYYRKGEDRFGVIHDEKVFLTEESYYDYTSKDNRIGRKKYFKLAFCKSCAQKRVVGENQVFTYSGICPFTNERMDVPLSYNVMGECNHCVESSLDNDVFELMELISQWKECGRDVKVLEQQLKELEEASPTSLEIQCFTCKEFLSLDYKRDMQDRVAKGEKLKILCRSCISKRSWKARKESLIEKWKKDLKELA